MSVNVSAELTILTPAEQKAIQDKLDLLKDCTKGIRLFENLINDIENILK